MQVFLTGKAKLYAPSVLHHIRATLSRIFALAKKNNFADANPAVGVELPAKHTVRSKVTFKPSDVQRIVDQLAHPYKAVAVTAALTGMRASEIFALTWTDVDFDRALIFVRRSLYRGEFGLPKTTASKRETPMSSHLVDVLREHQRLARPNPSGLLFADDAGKPIDAGYLHRRIMKPVLKTLGIAQPGAGWRSFRRPVATALSELHEPVKTAQHVLGHSSPTTTLAFYTQSDEKSQRDALSKLGELLFPSVPNSGKSEELIH